MSDWKVLTHGALEAVQPGLWCVSGTLPNLALNRNMVLWKSPDGGLVVHSPVNCDAPTMVAIEALGRPKWLIVPNEGHRMDIKAWKARYPDAVVLAPANARAKVAEVQAVEQTCEEALPPLGVRIHRPAGVKEGYELVYEIDLPEGGRALVVNDVLALPVPVPGFGGMMVGLLGPPGGRLGMPRIVKFFFGKDRKAFAGFVGELAQVADLRAVTFGHGRCLTGDCSGALREAAARL